MFDVPNLLGDNEFKIILKNQRIGVTVVNEHYWTQVFFYWPELCFKHSACKIIEKHEKTIIFSVPVATFFRCFDGEQSYARWTDWITLNSYIMILHRKDPISINFKQKWPSLRPAAQVRATQFQTEMPIDHSLEARLFARHLSYKIRQFQSKNLGKFSNTRHSKHQITTNFVRS